MVPHGEDQKLTNRFLRCYNQTIVLFLNLRKFFLPHIFWEVRMYTFMCRLTFSVFLFTSIVCAEGTSATYGTDIVIDKKLFDNGSNSNLDDVYGRAMLNPKYESSTFEAVILLYFYPEGFGYKVLHTNEDSSTSAMDIGKLQIWQAYGMVKSKNVDLLFGRNLVVNTCAIHFGNYIDEEAGGYFTGKGLFENCVEGRFRIGENNKLAVQFGTEDTKLNTG